MCVCVFAFWKFAKYIFFDYDSVEINFGNFLTFHLYEPIMLTVFYCTQYKWMPLGFKQIYIYRLRTIRYRKLDVDDVCGSLYLTNSHIELTFDTLLLLLFTRWLFVYYSLLYHYAMLKRCGSVLVPVVVDLGPPVCGAESHKNDFVLMIKTSKMNALFCRFCLNN